MKTFERLESEVRSYCRLFPTVFTTAEGAWLWDEQGRKYLDFFSGAGALNYGHNHPRLRERLVAYVRSGGVSHGLDMATAAKREFLERFEAVILKPRGLEYKVQFTGPTGADAVEAALKLARRHTGRQTVVCFTNGFHGMTLGALAVTTNPASRTAAGVPLRDVETMPFDTLDPLASLLEERRPRGDLPAAVIVEIVQAEGGLNVAGNGWLARLRELTREHRVLLIVDDVQAGCGRCGTFFSFEPAGLEPDLVTLSKSISGYGLPMALVLIRPELDVWRPGEHSGTFRGNNLAFVTAAEALEFWRTSELADAVAAKGERVRQRLGQLAQAHPDAGGEVRGRGLLQGIAFRRPELAAEIGRRAFARGLIMETAGPCGEVLKLMPPLVITEEDLDLGLDLIEDCTAAALASEGS